MCRSDVSPAAEAALARVLDDMRVALAAESGVNPDQVRVGPVDFGAVPTEPAGGQQR